MKLFEKLCYFGEKKSCLKWNNSSLIVLSTKKRKRNSSLMADLAKNKYKSIGWHVT